MNKSIQGLFLTAELGMRYSDIDVALVLLSSSSLRKVYQAVARFYYNVRSTDRSSKLKLQEEHKFLLHHHLDHKQQKHHDYHGILV